MDILNSVCVANGTGIKYIITGITNTHIIIRRLFHADFNCGIKDSINEVRKEVFFKRYTIQSEASKVSDPFEYVNKIIF